MHKSKIRITQAAKDGSVQKWDEGLKAALEGRTAFIEWWGRIGFASCALCDFMQERINKLIVQRTPPRTPWKCVGCQLHDRGSEVCAKEYNLLSHYMKLNDGYMDLEDGELPLTDEQLVEAVRAMRQRVHDLEVAP